MRLSEGVDESTLPHTPSTPPLLLHEQMVGGSGRGKEWEGTKKSSTSQNHPTIVVRAALPATAAHVPLFEGF